MTIRLDYFYGTDIGQFKFIRAPKLLFEVACYLRVSFEARMFFACLLDRVCLSMRNGLVDSKGRVYIFFTLKSAMKLTGYGHNKVERMYKELENAGLIERKAQGLGKPVRIYVKDFKEAEGMETEAAFEMEQMVMDGYAPETETPDCADESPESVRGDFPEKAAPVSAQTEAAPERTDAQTRIPVSPTAAQPRPEMPRPSARMAPPPPNPSPRLWRGSAPRSPPRLSTRSRAWLLDVEMLKTFPQMWKTPPPRPAPGSRKAP